MRFLFFLGVSFALLVKAVGAPPAVPAFRADRILLKPKRLVEASELARFNQTQGTALLKKFKTGGGLQVVKVPPSMSVASLLDAYRRSGLVEFVEPDYIRTLAAAPNDPAFLDGTLWGLNNSGQGGGVPDADIDAPEGWDVLSSASNVVVALLDTGIRPTHEDLAANMWTNTVLGGFGWNSLLGTINALDDEGHGCLMAGVLGAVGNNAKGICGVAWKVRMMACKAFNSSQQGSDSDIIEGIEFARTNGARIINLSFGGYGYSTALSNALYEASAAGIVLVAAAGNDGRNIDVTPYYPACYQIENLVSVGFSTRTDAIDTRSNYGLTNVDLVAPGTDIRSTFFVSDNSYLGPAFLYGSSFAAPYVSGTIALLVAQDPGASGASLIQRLLWGADRLPSLAGKCTTGGRLNLKSALVPPIRLSVVSGSAGSLAIEIRSTPARPFILEASPDLQSWTGVETNATTAGGIFTYSDSLPSGSGSRFYRAVAGE